MKKAIMTVCMVCIVPSMKGALESACYANDDTKVIYPNFPDNAPIYTPYYDDAGRMLYIYGCLSGKNVEMRVQHNGTIVLYDIISPGSLPAQYDCSGWETGSYRVTISADSTIVTTFSFEIS